MLAARLAALAATITFSRKASCGHIQHAANLQLSMLAAMSSPEGIHTHAMHDLHAAVDAALKLGSNIRLPSLACLQQLLVSLTEPNSLTKQLK